MPSTGLGEGHEKTNTGTYQNDGLRDTDVLTSPTLTSLNERGLLNGVIPTTPNLNSYNAADRNNPIAGNCHAKPNGSVGSTKEFYVDAGTVALDGMFYTVGSGPAGATAIDITAAGNYHASVHGSPIANGVAAGDEAIMIIYVDPRLPQNIGLAYGSYVDTATGLFPSAPFGHFTRQSVVLATMRVGKGATHPVIHSVEDKRVFIRPGPLPLTSLIDKDSATDHDNPRNDHISGLTAANLPITDLGLLFARDPTGHMAGSPDGAGQTHLFYQTDVSPLTSHQITPVHRTAKVRIAWGAPVTLTVGVAPPAGIFYIPLPSTEPNAALGAPWGPTVHLIEIFAISMSNPALASIKLVEGAANGYTVTGSPATALAIAADPAAPPFGGAGYDALEITYIHAGV